jgi:dihydropyrimidinase
MKTIIKNGTIVTSKKTFKADILIKDGKIALIDEDIQNYESDSQVIDATDCYIFPGGIDPHVHMHLPIPAGYSSDDFFTGSRAALTGGTTTIIDFVTPNKGQSLIEALEKRKKEAISSVINCYFHVSPIEWNENTENEIRECVKKGVKSFKVYMAYKKSIGLDDEVLEKVTRAIANAGGLLLVHAEMGDLIEEMRDKFASEGKLSPKYHCKSRPDFSESDAVKKVIDIANRNACPVYIVHLSAKASLEHIKNAQAKGWKVNAEVCPHHLLLDEKKYDGSFEETSKFVLSPPLRTKNDNDALWQALADEIIQTIGTDHCPFTSQQKAIGKDDFRKIPNGAGGVEHRMSLLYTYGVLKNRISLNRFVAVTSTNAAKTFGLYPQKGEIAVGSDADIVVWNPKVKSIISAKTHHQNCDVNIYEGFETEASAEVVIIGGEIVKNSQS